MRFRGEGLANAEAVLFGAGSIRCQAVAPDIGLGIEVIQIGKFAGRKEGGANVSNCAFDPAFGLHRQLRPVLAYRRQEP
jgi:hypothetical protein